MGMFDSVWFTCPNCGEEIEAQSKGGECFLANYTSDSVPVDVALDAHIYKACKCGKRYNVRKFMPERVRLELEEI